MSIPEGRADSQTPIISVCIPSYNRTEKLRRCLNSVLPQIPDKPVEVVVIDDASPDPRCAEVAEGFLSQYPGLRVIRNEKNLGYAGNQSKCVEVSRGRYTAILCDDDVYAPNAIDTMLPILSEGNYSFVALNYYSFDTDPGVVAGVPVASETSFERERGYDILDYPSVGHTSGFVLNTRVAQQVLERAWNTFTPAEHKRFRGILAITLPAYVVKESPLPGYFIGQRIVGACRPETVDYDNLPHICMDCYQIIHTLKAKGLLTQKDIQRRENEILGMLPRGLVRDGGFLDHAGYEHVNKTLRAWFEGDPRFKKASRILSCLRFGLVRFIFRLVARTYLILHGRGQRLQRKRTS